jgi:hypothetical protein
MGIPDHRPEGAPGRCDRYLPALQRELNRELIRRFRRLTSPTLRLPPGPRQELAALLVEFAEDLHCNLGIFTQRYRPVLGRDAACMGSFFDHRADDLVNQLIGIVFRQNMKSMEVYYHWLSAKYVAAFGKLHQPLVDTLFRYNQRDRKGAYIADLLAGRA